MSTVLVTSRSFSSGVLDLDGRLDAAGFEVVRSDPTHELTALRPLLAEAVAWIAGTGPVTAAHMDAAPGLRIIARYGVGVDGVDLAAARERGIVVTNTPHANSESVADHSLALMLALLRHVVPADRAVRGGDWQPRPSRELGALTIGVVGFGAVGRRVVSRLRGFGCEVLVADPFADPRHIVDAGAAPAPIEDLATRCDAVSLHAPGDAALIDAGWLARARRHLLIINTGRAQLIDEAAVVAALRQDRIGGVAADAFGGEYGSNDAGLAAPDIADRVVLSPHIASHTRDAVDRTSTMACDEVLTVLSGGDPIHPVHS
ncbi:MAG: NAD(P)-dependent oxidoreductase [Acidimicrobiia bacterium]|nr:NAD(P)-dependent oxidoreductase [Acidimicrobiia bacterium]